MRAREADLPRLAEMGARFHAASGLPGTFSRAAFYDSVLSLMESHEGAVFVSPGGMLGVAVGPLWYDRKALGAEELFWWSEDGSGRALLREAEQWARGMGATHMKMGAIVTPDIDRMIRLYGRLGYAPSEASFLKVL